MWMTRYLKGDNYLECFENVEATEALLEALGFKIHREKSILFHKISIDLILRILTTQSIAFVSCNGARTYIPSSSFNIH